MSANAARRRKRAHLGVCVIENDRGDRKVQRRRFCVGQLQGILLRVPFRGMEGCQNAWECSVFIFYFVNAWYVTLVSE